MKPAWLEIADGEIGVCEVRGGENPRILEYHSCTTLHANEDEVPWCSAFVNWCMQECGLAGTKLANARSWLDWGKKLDEPVEGCVVVLKRGFDPRSGHVGLYVGADDYYVHVLGGNQSDSVKVSKYPRSEVLGYRCPA